MPVTVRKRLSLALTILCALTGALMLFSAPAMAKEAHVFSSSFGSPGSGPGEFKEPYGVGVNDATGAVYVTDTGNNRVEQFAFDSTTKVYEYVAEFNGAAAITGVFESPEAIAVDNSGSALDPSKEDVYVVDEGHDVIDQFTASGTYLGQLSEALGGAPFGELQGIAVDPAGNVWVYENGGFVDEFSDTGSFVKRLNTERGTRPGLAVDSRDDAYVIFPDEEVGRFDSASGTKTAEFSSSAGALAIDSSTNDLLVDQESSIAEYGPFGEPSSAPVEQFTTEGLERAFGLAVDGNTGAVYVTQPGAGEVRVFAGVLQPDVDTGEASGLQNEGAATVHGTVDPDGLEVTSCKFEYGATTAYGSSAECSPSPGSGSASVAVSADLTGLIAPGALYHYRLVAGNVNGEDLGQDGTFFASAHPVITAESVSDVSLGEATVGAQINPGGLSTSYQVEYGSSTAYGSVTPEVSAGASTEASGVRIHLKGLQSSSLYHARIVARNEFGVVPGGDLTFTTATAGGPSASALPDNRVYEAVSLPADTDGEAYHPLTGHELESDHQLRSAYAVRASADGDAIAYDAEAPTVGGSGSTGDGGGNTFLAKRGASGWSPTDIMPPVQAREVYAGFSSDLSVSFLQEFELPLTPDVLPDCEVLYSRTGDGAYRALYATTTETPGHCAVPRFAGVSADGSSVIFESEARLTPEAPEGGEGADNLYDSVDGRAYLVNVLPNGTPEANAAFGGVSQESDQEAQGAYGYRHYGQVISADGSRIVWSDLSTGDLYVRKDAASPGASTALVATEGYYRGASGDGSKILFTKGGDLYEYDVDTETTTDLAPGGSVLGVLGSSEDVSYVYFVADGVLASNENAHGEKPAAGQPNLYLDAGGDTRFIATLSPADNAVLGREDGLEGEPGDWRAGLNLRTAEVTPDGRAVVFMSRRSITGYDNEGGCLTPEGEPAGCSEVFVYDADTRELSCASCNPTGAPPVAARGHEGQIVGGAFLQPPNTQTGTGAASPYQLREISDDGSRVFFDTAEPLVPQDSNGAEDVYEWERSGSGTCREPRGCVYLISGALSSEESVFLDASASGDDVFFTTRAQLVPQDRNELIDVYDARVDGGFAETSLACIGTGCQGVPSAPPTFATPSSATFSGIGNFPPPTPSKIKPKPKKRRVRCKKGFVAKHGKCVRQKKKAGKVGKSSKRHATKGRK